MHNLKLLKIDHFHREQMKKFQEDVSQMRLDEYNVKHPKATA